MGKKHKKHKAEKAEWRSASATTYSGKNSGGRGGAVERGGAPLCSTTCLCPRGCRQGSASLRGLGRSGAPEERSLRVRGWALRGWAAGRGETAVLSGAFPWEQGLPSAGETGLKQMAFSREGGSGDELRTQSRRWDTGVKCHGVFEPGFARLLLRNSRYYISVRVMRVFTLFWQAFVMLRNSGNIFRCIWESRAAIEVLLCGRTCWKISHLADTRNASSKQFKCCQENKSVK